MSYKVYHRFTDGTFAELCDELYDTLEEADEAGRQATSDYDQGGDVLELAGEGRGPEIIDWYMVEV